MAELRSEEEQLDAIKRWWKDNGKSLILGVAVAVAAVVGWKAWERYQHNQAAAASASYQELLGLAGQDTLDDKTIARADELIGTLRNEHGGTLYADLAALIQARLEVADDDLAGARQALSSVIDTSDDAYLKGLARLRLARIQVADGHPQAALDTLDAGVPDSLGASQAMTRGDALVALDRDDEARSAYRKALDLSREQGQPVFGAQLKLDNLGAEDATL
ncbi:tetratricopeptide repeat protein [Modicisalibacter sp. 'Wilcox']|uniref:YfgM family protein n=1 Tax=Modicisalibacter sp. 'Wilcox' TaxID=2679914 RepID=UPI0013D7ACF4|nr:tetratricopeptide repeat protein [Modicisalibacter sp. 'Wilcox']